MLVPRSARSPIRVRRSCRRLSASRTGPTSRGRSRRCGRGRRNTAAPTRRGSLPSIRTGDKGFPAMPAASAISCSDVRKPDDAIKVAAVCRISVRRVPSSYAPPRPFAGLGGSDGHPVAVLSSTGARVELFAPTDRHRASLGARSRRWLQPRMVAEAPRHLRSSHLDPGRVISRCYPGRFCEITDPIFGLNATRLLNRSDAA